MYDNMNESSSIELKRKSDGNDASSYKKSESIKLPSVSKAISDAKELAISTIQYYDFVYDAAISEKSGDYSLVLIVNDGISVSKAKELGENFVRLFKSHIPSYIEPNPTKNIGSGNYNYLIGVYGQSNKKICFGAKASNARSISW